jgi:hypothetical protein
VGQIAVNNVENVLFLDLNIKAGQCEKKTPALSRDSLLYTNLTRNNKYLILFDFYLNKTPNQMQQSVIKFIA